MSSPFTPVPVPVVLPEVQIANQIINGGNALFSKLLKQYTRSYDTVWNNQVASADKIVAAMGTNAQRVFALSADLANFLVTAGATDIPTTMPSGWNYVPNPDGSVTLTPILSPGN